MYYDMKYKIILVAISIVKLINFSRQITNYHRYKAIMRML